MVVRRIAIFLICLTVSRGFAAEDRSNKTSADEKVYELTDDMAPPRLIHRVDPEYSSESKGVRLEGSVFIETVIASTGSTRDLKVVKGLEIEVDQAAIAAVRQWRFAPAQKDKRPVAVRVTIEVVFHPM